MWAADPADDSGDIAIEMEETCRGHVFPIDADSGYAFPVGLEALEGEEVDAGVFFE